MYTCVVCGYNQLEKNQYIDNEYPGFTICPCCGFESGFDDKSEGISIEEYRYEWVMRGAKWWSDSTHKPDVWDYKVQLKTSGLYEWTSGYDVGGFADLDSYKRGYRKTHINCLNKYGRSDLHRAIYYKKFDIAEFLIKEGIDVNLTNPIGRTALHLAAHKISKSNINEITNIEKFQ